MIIFKAILLFTAAFCFADVAYVFSEIDGPTWVIIIASVGTLATTVFGALAVWGNSQSKNRIEEMKVQMELERIKNEAHREVQKVQAEAQKAVSLVNAQALSSLQTSMATNTVETVKAVAAADQTKQRVEQLEQKLPVKQSETTDVHVVNPADDPVNTRPQ